MTAQRLRVYTVLPEGLVQLLHPYLVALIAYRFRFWQVLSSLAFVVTRTPMHRLTQRHKNIVKKYKHLMLEKVFSGLLPSCVVS